MTWIQGSIAQSTPVASHARHCGYERYGLHPACHTASETIALSASSIYGALCARQTRRSNAFPMGSGGGQQCRAQHALQEKRTCLAAAAALETAVLAKLELLVSGIVPFGCCHSRRCSAGWGASCSGLMQARPRFRPLSGMSKLIGSTAVVQATCGTNGQFPGCREARQHFAHYCSVLQKCASTNRMNVLCSRTYGFVGLLQEGCFDLGPGTVDVWNLGLCPMP